MLGHSELVSCEDDPFCTYCVTLSVVCQLGNPFCNGNEKSPLLYRELFEEHACSITIHDVADVESEKYCVCEEAQVFWVWCVLMGRRENGTGRESPQGIKQQMRLWLRPVVGQREKSSKLAVKLIIVGGGVRFTPLSHENDWHCIVCRCLHCV